METAAIYARVSTLKQEKFGISQEAQVARCAQYAETMGFEVVYTGIEAESAKDEDRPILQAILDMVAKKQITHILTVKLCRLHRETENAIRLGKLLAKKHVGLHLVTEGGAVDLSDPSQEMMFTMRAAMADRKSTRLNSSH